MRWSLVLALISVAAVTPASSAPSARRSTIVFASSRAAEIVRPALYTIGTDGRGRHRVTPKWRGIEAPSWSPTGRWIAFERYKSSTYVVSSHGGRPVLVGGRGSGVGATWSPNGAAIAMVAHHDLAVARPGRWRARRLVRAIQAGPSWFPGSRQIAYSRGGREISVVDARTGVRRPLLRALVRLTDLAVSPDGTKVAYTYVSPEYEIYDLYIADLRTGLQRRIARALEQPAWSPDGRWIAGISGGDAGRLDVLATDGSKRVRIARLRYDEDPRPPMWSPDSSRLLVSRYDVFSVRRDGHGWRRITYERPRFDIGFDDQATWSPDGKRIAFVSEKHEDPDADLYEIGLDGGRPRALTSNSRSDFAPAWSPDGTTLAFAHSVGRVPYVALLRPGGRIRRLGLGSNPAWSPDGRQIAFDRGGDIFVMSAAGKNAHAVTLGPETDSEPDWSPNGQRIAFVRERTEDQDVWSIAAGGGDLLRITEVHAGIGQCAVRLAFSPAWSPDGSEIAYSLLDGGSLSCGSRGTWESIEAVAADGSRRTRLVTDGGRADPLSGDGAYEPSWSPDGRTIAFMDTLAERSRIAVVPSVGGRFRFVTPRTYEAFGPDWRP